MKSRSKLRGPNDESESIVQLRLRDGRAGAQEMHGGPTVECDGTLSSKRALFSQSQTKHTESAHAPGPCVPHSTLPPRAFAEISFTRQDGLQVRLVLSSKHVEPTRFPIGL
ncbi:hypothetical protein ACFX15_001724 [Malus domestica]